MYLCVCRSALGGGGLRACVSVYVGTFVRIASGLAGTSSGLGRSVLSGHQWRGGRGGAHWRLLSSCQSLHASLSLSFPLSLSFHA